MDIKPFSEPLPDFWASLEPLSVIMLLIAVLSLLGAVVCGVFFKNDRFAALPLFLIFVAFVSSLFGSTSGLANMQTIQKNHYDNAVSGLKDNLTRDGFKIYSGTPDLNPNTQSSMLLSYQDKKFDCTLFSPEDVNETIVFSCGEAKLSLDQIKEQR